MEIYDVVKKLVGSIDPAGQSHIDEVRYENLEKHIALVDELVSDLIYVAKTHNNGEASLIKASNKADKYLKMIKDDLTNK